MRNPLSPPAVSIIIPSYNQACFLKEALRSVLAQTFARWEVIVVNNFSEDNTVEVVQAFKDPRIRLVNFRNYGIIGASRNEGIRQARADVIAFLDSDDIWYPTKLARVAAAFHADSAVDAICHNQDYIKGDRVVGQSRYGPPPLYRGSLRDYLVYVAPFDCMNTSGVSVKTRCLLEVGLFDESPNLITLEDYDLWIRLAQACRFRFLPEILGGYRYHEASQTAAGFERHLANHLAYMERLIGPPEGKNNGRSSRLVRRRYAMVFYGAGRYYCWAGDLRRSFVCFVRALRTDLLLPKTYAGLACWLMAAFSRIGKRGWRRLDDATRKLSRD